MGKNVSAPVIGTDERTALLELISKKKGKGGNQSDSARFTSLWVTMTKKTGVNDDNVEILYKGFALADATPFFHYVKESRDNSAYAKLIAAKPSKLNEKGIALKALLNLFSFELVTPTSLEPLGLLSRAIPNAATNRDGKEFGILGQAVQRLLVKPLAQKAINVEARIQPGDALKLLSILKPHIEKAGSREGASSFETKASIQLLKWLTRQANRDGAVGSFGAPKPTAMADNSLERKSESAQRNGSIRVEVDGDSTKDAGNATQEAPSPRKRAKSQDLDMSAVLQYLSDYQSDHESLTARNKELREERKTNLQAISALERRVRDIGSENSKLQAQISSLSERYASLQAENATLKSTIESLQSDLSSAQEMLAMIDQREARQANEATRRLARELKVEHKDFLDAADLPMSVDLGENMRDQLRSIFEIIASNGIDL